MKPKTKLFYMECHVAGRQYYEAGEVWDKLKVGAALRLERDLENRYDPSAIAVVYYDKETDEEYQLGYIPRSDNGELAKFLEMGYADIFEARLSRIDPDEHYEQQLFIVVKIRRAPAACPK